MSKYGPNDSYPEEILCESCNEKVFIQWSGNTLKEYITENKAWQKGTNGATFHKCSNWKGKTKPVKEKREWIEEKIKEGNNEVSLVPYPKQLLCPIAVPCWEPCKKEYCGVY
ncbi:hypothetical protein LCGC14_2429160, partial [marine sediment metagenome]